MIGNLSHVVIDYPFVLLTHNASCLAGESIMGKFEIKSSADGGYMFNLKANNGQVICTSQVYSSLDACKKGTDSIKRFCMSEIEDQTSASPDVKKNPKYEVYLDKASEFRFRLKASNGEIIAASQGYNNKSSCMNGIESIQVNAPDAEVVVLEE